MILILPCDSSRTLRMTKIPLPWGRVARSVRRGFKRANLVIITFLCYNYPCRTPRGLCGSLDPNAYAGCRACCEGYRKIAYVCMAVDSLKYDGASCRTVSGWKHSSTKTILAGVISLKSRS